MKYYISTFFSCCLLLFFCIRANAQNPTCLGEQGQLKWLLWENHTGDRLDELTHLHRFPQQPDAQEIISTIQSPGIASTVETDEGGTYLSVQYGSFYGSLIRGYITVPQTGDYTFNITGDDECRFFLSTDGDKENLVLQASVDDWTYREEYVKVTEMNQTSSTIPLITGQYYYFEVWQKENGGGDHVEVKWKTPANTATWGNIPSTNVYDFNCADCPPSGTTCDDGNANTLEDQEDGFCNCIGIPTTASDCVGKRGEIKALYYLDITGNNLNDLFNAEKYPLMPDTTELLEILKGPLVDRDTYGTRISGLLKVPVSGNYQFSVTGDDRNSFKLSSNESPDNAVEISYASWSEEYNQYRYETQVSDPITLNKDNFYYFEMNHKQGSGGDRFGVFWKTPFMGDTLWRYVDNTYLYGYNCELACIPEGTPCDDNNDFTIKDQYDANCNCAGIPCSGADCDETPALTYEPSPECGVSEKIDTSPANVWESCSPSSNPNPARGNSHWIQYDLGQVYLLNESHIWNYNVAGEIGKGFREVVIDYSTNGTTWTQLSTSFNWAQAPGTIGYEGFEGPNFNGITARYIVITALSNWNNNACRGFSKITINATDCLLMGQECDDEDPNSMNDKYDANCKCIGSGIIEESICGPEDLTINDMLSSSGEYRATRIYSEATITSTGDIQFIASEYITLLPGFHAQEDSEFLANIVACDPMSTQEETEQLLTQSRAQQTTTNTVPAQELHLTDNHKELTKDLGNTNLQVYPNPTQSWTSFSFNLPISTPVSLCIYAANGKKVNCLSNNTLFNEGIYTKEFPAQRLTQGMYYVVLRTDEAVVSKPFVVIDK